MSEECDPKIQITPEGKIKWADDKIQLAVIKNWKAIVHIQLVDCVVSCHTGDNYNISLDFTTDSEEPEVLKFIPGTHCLAQTFQWCCGDPDQEPPTNQNCVVCREPGDPEDCDEDCKADMADIVIEGHDLDPPYPEPCVPVDRGFYSDIFVYYVNEWVHWVSFGGDGNFYIRITAPDIPPAGTRPDNTTYWRQLIDESPPSYGVGCTGNVSYRCSMAISLALYQGEWYLSFTFGLSGNICGANLGGVYPASGLETLTTGDTLEIGKQYCIVDFHEGDDFTNVGADRNALGILFVATGTTPTEWSFGSVLTDMTFPFNVNLGDDPTGDYHYESGLGGTPTTPGTLIADIHIEEAE